jgi:glycosyltransferase involved in cell wall biosynthesis
MPCVSILIPAYNAERWLGDTVQSALNQTWPDKEIIIVDDGSRDRTLAVARKFETAGVKVVTHSNQGPARTRNHAFSLCQGDYIQWLDADDLLAPDKIELQMRALAEGGDRRTLLSSEWAIFLFRPETAEFIQTELWSDQSPAEWLIRKMGKGLYMQTSTWLVSRELTEAAGPWDVRLTLDDDGEYFCRVLQQSESIKFVPGAKVYYRASGPEGMSYAGRSDRKLESQWLSMQLHIGYLRSMEESPRVRAACVNYLQNWLGYFHPYRKDIVESAKRLAEELGGRLESPHVSWKYSWVESTLGRDAAERVRMLSPSVRRSLQGAWEKTLLRIQNQRQILPDKRQI